MTDLSRRGFLKAVGIVAAGSLAVPAFSLIVPSVQVPAGNEWLGSARELFQYDISWDRFIGRIEIATSREQLGVDFRIDVTPAEQFHADLAAARKMVAERLKAEMDSRGILLADLRRLPIPDGYEEPNWVKLSNRTMAA